MDLLSPNEKADSKCTEALRAFAASARIAMTWVHICVDKDSEPHATGCSVDGLLLVTAHASPGGKDSTRRFRWKVSS